MLTSNRQDHSLEFVQYIEFVYDYIPTKLSIYQSICQILHP